MTSKVGFSPQFQIIFVCFVHLCIRLSFPYLFQLLESGKAEEHDVQQPATGTQPVATLACVTASLRVPVLLAGAGKSGASCRPDWPTVRLRDYSYHSSALALSRAKVTSVTVACGKWTESKNYQLTPARNVFANSSSHGPARPRVLETSYARSATRSSPCSAC